MAAPDTTPVTGVPPASPIPIVTFPTSPAITVALRPIPVASVRLANLVLRRQTRPAAPMGRKLVPTAAAEPDCAAKGIPTATAVHRATAVQTLGEVRLRLLPRPVPAAQLRVPVTKPPLIPIATPAPADTLLRPAHPITSKPGQQLKSALAVQLPVPATSAEPKHALMVAMYRPAQAVKPELPYLMLD